RDRLNANTAGLFLFPDALTINFERFKMAMETELNLDHLLPLFGGLASDNWQWKQTYQYCNDQVTSDSAAWALLSGNLQIAGAVNHGCVSLGDSHKITRSDGNVIYEIDGKPSVETLRKYLSEAELTTGWGTSNMQFPLGFKLPDSVTEDYGQFFLRAMMSKDDQTGAVTVPTEVSQDEIFYMTRRDYALMVNGINRLGHQIKQQIGDQQLTEQVRRLVAAENELYRIQSKLDLKLRLYRQLYEVSNQFNATFDLDEVLQIVIRFVLYELNFERCLLLLPTLEGKAFQVQALDGYYTDGEQEALSKLQLSATEPALLPLITKAERIICPANSDQEVLRELGHRFHMDEYAILSLGGKAEEPIGLLIAGNSAEMAGNQERVEAEGEAIISLANLANQATTTMKNLRFYQASKRFVPEEFLEFFQKGSIVDIALGDHLSKEMT